MIAPHVRDANLTRRRTRSQGAVPHALQADAGRPRTMKQVSPELPAA
jgi:hypothetical protein